MDHQNLTVVLRAAIDPELLILEAELTGLATGRCGGIKAGKLLDEESEGFDVLAWKTSQVRAV